MLDKTSEKILKAIISKYKGIADVDIPISSEETKLHYTELNELCSFLHKQGYVNSFYESYNPKEPVKISLTYEGIHYFEIKRKNIFYLCLKSIWIPIIVTLLTKALTFLIKYLWPPIQQLLSNIP